MTLAPILFFYFNCSLAMQAEAPPPPPLNPPPPPGLPIDNFIYIALAVAIVYGVLKKIKLEKKIKTI